MELLAGSDTSRNVAVLLIILAACVAVWFLLHWED